MITTCFSGGSRGRSPCTSHRGTSPRSRGQSAPPPPPVDVAVDRVSSPRGGETERRKGRKLWAEVKVHTKTGEEQELEEALENIQSSLAYLLAVDRRKKWQEAQIRHLGYYPQEKLPRSALWDPPNLL